VSEAILKELFTECGHVTRVTIRCISGTAVAKAPAHKLTATPLSDASLLRFNEMADRVYATVEFSSRSAVEHALGMTGTVIAGTKSPIVVCQRADELPEAGTLPRRTLHIRRRVRVPTAEPPTTTSPRPLARRASQLQLAEEKKKERARKIEERREKGLLARLLPSFPITVA